VLLLHRPRVHHVCHALDRDRRLRDVRRDDAAARPLGARPEHAQLELWGQRRVEGQDEEVRGGAGGEGADGGVDGVDGLFDLGLAGEEDEDVACLCGGGGGGLGMEWGEEEAASGLKVGSNQLLHTAQHSTAQHSTAQHSTAQHSTAQHTTAQHSTARHGTA